MKQTFRMVHPETRWIIIQVITSTNSLYGILSNYHFDTTTYSVK